MSHCTCTSVWTRTGEHTEVCREITSLRAEVERLRGLLDQNETEAHRLIRWRREAEADAERLRLVLEEITQCGCEACHAQARAALTGKEKP